MATRLCLVLLFLAAGLLSCKPNDPTPTRYLPPPDVHDEQDIPYPQVPRISVADAKAKSDAKSSQFVDVRGQREYDTAHIPGAVSLPLDDLLARYRELPREREIITYCD